MFAFYFEIGPEILHADSYYLMKNYRAKWRVNRYMTRMLFIVAIGVSRQRITLVKLSRIFTVCPANSV